MARLPPALTPRPLRDILPDAVAESLRDQPMSQAKLEFAWRTAAGAAVARLSTVTLDGTTLRVEVPGPLWAVEIERARDGLLQKLARVLGPGIVERLVVRAPAGEERRTRPVKRAGKK